jgi:2-dehydro-3-deoxyglucarate aldolase
MSSELQRNHLRRTIEDGDVAFGVIDGLYSPTLVELIGDIGFDFAWLDFEHGGPSPWDGQRLEDLLRAADAGGTELLVRLPSSDPALVRKALDAGVRNVFISRVETSEEVRRAVEAARFEYDGGPGQRGLASPRASRWGAAADYPGTEDSEVMVGVTVETVAALRNIEDIVSVPELGFVFVGPKTSLEHDVAVGGLTFGMDDVRDKVDDGYQLLNVGSTVGAVRSQLGDWLESYEHGGS